jgi:hypothetical protein
MKKTLILVLFTVFSSDISGCCEGMDIDPQWAKCKQLDDTPIEATINHPSIVSIINVDRNDEPKPYTLQFWYNISDEGVLSFEHLAKVRPRRTFERTIMEVSKSFEFENIKEFSGECFYFTLQLDKGYFNKSSKEDANKNSAF